MIWIISQAKYFVELLLTKVPQLYYTKISISLYFLTTQQTDQGEPTMNDSWKITTACFIGGAFCALVAKAMAPAWWWVGMLVGFLAGYLSFRFKEVVAAARKAITELPGEIKKYQEERRQFHIDNPYRRALNRWRWVTTAVCIGPLVITIWGFRQNLSWCQQHEISLLILLITFLTPFMTLLIRNHESLFDMFYCQTHNDEDMIKRHRDYALKFNIVCLVLFWPAYLFIRYVVLKAPQWAPTTTVCLWRAAKKVFITIHSDERLLCGTDGALGGAIAYHLFNGALWVVLTGGVLGALIGLLNYQLVSVHWLKLVPARTK